LVGCALPWRIATRRPTANNTAAVKIAFFIEMICLHLVQLNSLSRFFTPERAPTPYLFVASRAETLQGKANAYGVWRP
jgi:hypothetical protein